MSRTPLSAGVAGLCLLPLLASGQTQRVADLNTTGAGSNSYNFFRLGSSTFFLADDGEHGKELWVKPDGSNAHLVKDINPGPLSSTPSNLTAIGTMLFFSARTGEHGRELWKSDGTEAGTVLVADIRPGTEGSGPNSLTPYGGSLVFSAEDPTHGTELWKSDGSTVSLVLDIEPGSESSSPREFRVVPDGTPGGSMLIFSARTAAEGTEPWRTYGTAANTQQLADLNPGAGSSNPGGFAALNDQWIFMRASDGDGSDLWQYEPSTNTWQEHQVAPTAGAFPFYLTVFEGHVYFQAYHPDYGTEAWRVDGTSPPAVIDIDTGTGGSSPRDFVVAGGTLFFSAETAAAGRELWYIEDSVGTAGLAVDASPGPASGDPLQITASAAGAVFFGADDGVNGSELWMAPGATPAAASPVKDIYPGSGSGMTGRIVADATGVTFLGDDGVHGSEPWHSDGTEAGTLMLTDINVDTAAASPSGFAAFGGEVYFRATGDGRRARQ